MILGSHGPAICGVFLVLSVCVGAAARPAEAPTDRSRDTLVLRPNQEEVLLSLVDADLLGAEWSVAGVLVGMDTVVFQLRSGERNVDLILGSPGLEGALHSAHFSIRWRASGVATEQDAAAVGIVAGASVLANDRFDVWEVLRAPRESTETAQAATSTLADEASQLVMSLVRRVVYPGIVLFVMLAGLVRSGVTIRRSPRRVPILVVGVVAMGVLALLQTRVEPFLADLRENLSLVLHDPGHGRYSMVWQSVLQVLPRPWDLALVASVNRVVAVLSVVPMLALLDSLFEDARCVAAGVLGMATSSVLIMFSVSTVQQIPLLFMLAAAAVHLAQWHRTGRSGDLLLAAASAACMIDLRPEGVFELIPLALLPAGLGGRLRRPAFSTFLAACILFLGLSSASLVGTFGEIGGADYNQWIGRNPLFYMAFPIFAVSVALTVVSPLVGTGLVAGWLVFLRGSPHFRALAWLLLSAAATSLGLVFVGRVTNHRYVLVALVFRSMLLGVLAYLLAARLAPKLLPRFARVAPWAAVALVLLSQLLAQRSLLETRWPHSIDYAFLVKHVAALPDGSRIMAQVDDSSIREAGFVLPGAVLSRLLGKEHEWVSFDETARLDPQVENYLHLGTGCWNTYGEEIRTRPDLDMSRGNPRCLEIIRTLSEFANLHLVERVRVRAASFGREVPLAPEYPISWYRIELRR